MTEQLLNPAVDPIVALRSGAYDFVDFGCSDGKSIEIAKRLFSGGRGLGLDLDANKVALARATGYEADLADLTTLAGCDKSVRFVIANHFLEHLSDPRQAQSCIRAACALARDFVIIKQPWFDSDSYLLAAGLKFYWSDWAGHPNHMSTLDFFKALRPLLNEGLAERYALYGVGRVVSSDDTAIHSLFSPPNQHQWESPRHPPKPTIRLEQPVFKEIAAIVQCSGQQTIESLERHIPGMVKLHDSALEESFREVLPRLPFEWAGGQNIFHHSGTIAEVQMIDSGLRLRANGSDPFLYFPDLNYGAERGVEVAVKVSAPCETTAQIFFMTQAERGYKEQRSVSASVKTGLNELRLKLKAPDIRGRLRLDPGGAPGEYVVHWRKVTTLSP